MRPIRPGAIVVAQTSDNKEVTLRAVTGVIDGDDFPVVWVCGEAEWQAATADRRDPQAVPWPADSVREVSKATV